MGWKALCGVLDDYLGRLSSRIFAAGTAVVPFYDTSSPSLLTHEELMLRW